MTTLSTHSGTPERAPSQEPEASSAVSLILTFVPLVILVVLFVSFVRLRNQSMANVEKSLKLSSDALGELRAIRSSSNERTSTSGAEGPAASHGR